LTISIVTISYNQAKFVERAIRSVLNQNYNDVEYIIVDAGSIDGSQDIIERYRPSFARVICEPDSGPTDGLNKGFSVATGDIFGCLNSDDFYLCGGLGEVARCFEAHPEADVIYGNGYIVDENSKLIRRFYSDPYSLWRHGHGASVVMQQSTFFKASAFRDVGGFSLDNPIWWDGELLMDFALAGKKFERKSHFWSGFTIHKDSISGQKRQASPRAAQVAHDRDMTAARMRKKALGDASKSWSAMLDHVAYIEKRVLNPLGTAWRIAEHFGIGVGSRIDSQ